MHTTPTMSCTRPTKDHQRTCATVQNPIRILHEPCTNPVRTLHETCTNTARTLYEPCTNPVRTLHEHCANPVRTLHEPCTNTARTLYGNCTNPVRTMHEPCMYPVQTLSFTKRIRCPSIYHPPSGSLCGSNKPRRPSSARARQPMKSKLCLQ